MDQILLGANPVRSWLWADCSSHTELSEPQLRGGAASGETAPLKLCWASTERRRQSPHTQCAAHHLNTMSPIHLIRHITVRLTEKRKHVFSWKLLIWSSAHFTWSKFKSIFPNIVFNVLKKMQRVIIIIIISAHIDIMFCCRREKWWWGGWGGNFRRVDLRRCERTINFECLMKRRWNSL